MAKKYWLMKSEPSAYSIDDLEQEPDQICCWDGIRNYQARNFMRDDMQVGDLAFFYHSNTDPVGIVGIVEVVREAYPDHTAFDANEKYYDPKSDLENPRWLMVDVRLKEKFDRTITLAELRGIPELMDMALLQRGQRLSIQPVAKEEWEKILTLR